MCVCVRACVRACVCVPLFLLLFKVLNYYLFINVGWPFLPGACNLFFHKLLKCKLLFITFSKTSSELTASHFEMATQG